MQLLGTWSVMAVVQREDGMRHIRAFRSLSGNDQDRVLWVLAPISHNHCGKLCCAETVMWEKVPKCVGGCVLLKTSSQEELLVHCMTSFMYCPLHDQLHPSEVLVIMLIAAL